MVIIFVLILLLYPCVTPSSKTDTQAENKSWPYASSELTLTSKKDLSAYMKLAKNIEPVMKIQNPVQIEGA